MSAADDARARMRDCIAQVLDAQARLDEILAEAREEVLADQAQLAQTIRGKLRPIGPMELNVRAESKMVNWPPVKDLATSRDRMTQQAIMYGIASLVESR
jgi:hypothetical protein